MLNTLLPPSAIVALSAKGIETSASTEDARAVPQVGVAKLGIVETVVVGPPDQGVHASQLLRQSG